MGQLIADNLSKHVQPPRRHRRYHRDDCVGLLIERFELLFELLERHGSSPKQITHMIAAIIGRAVAAPGLPVSRNERTCAVASGASGTRPRRAAATTACRRLATPSSSRIRLMWHFTVAAEIFSRRPISLFGRPSHNSASTWSSRGVR